MDKFVGKRIDGRYEIREIIGVGGMSVVYKAYDSVEDRIVAVKILKEEFVSNEEFVRRFKNESKAISVLSHPNIVKVFDVSFGDLIQYIVMEYIDGITLKEYIERKQKLQWSEAVFFAIQILRGLQHAHDKGIIHRDVKPQNIMLLSDGTIKVTDFGIARFARSEQRTMTDKAIGSVHYISPEQAKGGVTDEKADIYSVGVILYEMLTGCLPFQAESAVMVAMMHLQNEAKSICEIDSEIPVGLEQIVTHAMQKIQENRYKTAAEMLRDLEEFKRDPELTFEYAYFVDDSPTKYIGSAPKVSDETALTAEEEEPSKLPIIPILTGVAVAFFVAAIVFFGIFVNQKLNPKTTAVECPNFVGMTYEEAQSQYGEKFNLQFEFIRDNSYEQGKVFEQTPTAGTLVKSEKITLSVGWVEDTVMVPDVANYTELTAKQTLSSIGFTNVMVDYVSSTTVATGNVCYTVPNAGSTIYTTDSIVIYVSTGKKEVFKPVPNLLQLDEESAKKRIIASGFTVGEITEVDSSTPKGYVVAQDPDSATTTQALEGTVINFQISSGKEAANYNLDVSVSLPTDCSFNVGYLSAFMDGKSVAESSQIYFDEVGSYIFKLSSTKPTAVVKVKLSNQDKSKTYNYLDLTVDFSNSTYKITNRYNEYPKGSTDGE